MGLPTTRRRFAAVIPHLPETDFVPEEEKQEEKITVEEPADVLKILEEIDSINPPQSQPDDGIERLD